MDVVTLSDDFAGMEMKSYFWVMGILIRPVLLRREEIRHPHPELAVNLGLLVVGLTIREVLVLHAIWPQWKPLLPKDEEALVRELVRTFLAYLGVEAEDGVRPRSL